MSIIYTKAENDVMTPSDRLLLKDALKSAVVKVKFLKASSEKRIMHCTLDSDMIPEDKIPAGGSKRVTDKEQTSLPVFDLDLQEWRSFTYNRVLSWSV